MKKLIFPIALGVICTSFTVVSPGDSTSAAPVVSPVRTISPSDNSVATALYCGADLEYAGLSRIAFDYAWKGYQKLVENKRVARPDYLTICDFSQSSSRKRLYIIDVNKGILIRHTYVAHGKNSGGEYASRFSNTPESLQSSLGFFVTQQTYTGEHGLSLRIAGAEPGFNDKALARSIVIHGAEYVDGARARAGIFMGRSYGCPAVPKNESTQIINIIKNGSCLFIYHPSKNYLQHSKILND
jgi:L,D-transpeptidase catalytic domain